MGGDPAPAGNVGDGDSVTDEEARGRLGEVGVHGAVQAAGLVDVAVDAVLDRLRGISYPGAVRNRQSGIGYQDSRLKWFAWPCMGPKPPICHMSCCQC